MSRDRNDLTGRRAFIVRSCLLCASALLDLQVDCADMCLQGALLPEGDVRAVLARVVPALLVNHLDVPHQVALLPESTRAMGARVVPALLVHRHDVLLQGAGRSERNARAERRTS